MKHELLGILLAVLFFFAFPWIIKAASFYLDYFVWVIKP